MIKFIYFDLGGVLYNYSQGFKSLADLLHISLKTCTRIRNESRYDICTGKITPQELWKRYKNASYYKGPDIDFIDFWTDQFIPIKKVHNYVKMLSKNWNIGLLTNTYPGIFDVALKKRSIPNVSYAAIVQSCDVGFIKPENEIYKIAQRKSGVKPSEILFIDDSRKHVKAAKNLGWNSLVFDTLSPQKSIDEINMCLERY